MSASGPAHPRPGGGAVILVTAVGSAAGLRAAAAALACAGAEPDLAALLVELGDGRPPRPGLIASAGARALEERLAAHLPEASVASRGRICRLALPLDLGGVDLLPGVLAIARDAIAVVQLPPSLFRAALEEPRVRASGALLRADLGADRALTALTARDLAERGLRVAVLKRPLGWAAARLALAGLLPAGAAGALPPRIRSKLLCEPAGMEADPLLSQGCYCRQHDAEPEPAGIAQQERRGDAGSRPGGGLHRDPERGAGR